MTTHHLGQLNLGHILTSCGLDPDEVLVLRHTYSGGGLRRGEVTDESMLAYARTQRAGWMSSPPRLWLNFLAEGGRRARLWGSFENQGEVLSERTDEFRSFDLKPSDVMSALAGRLVIEWGMDTINWSKRGPKAAAYPIVEIADPEAVPFPGFDRLIATRVELQAIVEDPRYTAWRAALGSVQGIYLITDGSDGRQYVGKADGGERILGRWRTYAANGHGSNKELASLLAADPEHAKHFQWSLLRVFGPSTPKAEVDEAEAHFKRSLLTRKFGLNGN